MKRQLPPDHILAPYQNDLHTERLHRADRTFYFRLRGVIAAHCVNCDGHHSLAEPTSRLFFGDFNDFPALVLAAGRANTVR